jgi:hypothetical protein
MVQVLRKKFEKYLPQKYGKVNCGEVLTNQNFPRLFGKFS